MLPAGFTAAVIVLQHVDANLRSRLADILRRHSHLPVVVAAPGMVVRAGVVYVAPPGDHLVVNTARRLRHVHTPPVNYVRPSADVLFRSVAETYGAGATAVVLSGLGRDGAAGAAEIKRWGGTVLVQDEASAEFFGMPGATVGAVAVDSVLPPSEIGAALARLGGGG